MPLYSLKRLVRTFQVGIVYTLLALGGISPKSYALRPLIFSASSSVSAPSFFILTLCRESTHVCAFAATRKITLDRGSNDFRWFLVEINSFPAEKWAYENSFHYLSRLSYANNIYTGQNRETREMQAVPPKTWYYFVCTSRFKAEAHKEAVSLSFIVSQIEFICIIHTMTINGVVFYCFLKIQFSDCTLHFGGSKYLIFQNDC